MATAAPAAERFPATLPPGLRARRPDLDRDADAIKALVRAYCAAYVRHPTMPPETVVADIAGAGDGYRADTWLVEVPDGQSEGEPDAGGTAQLAGLGWFEVLSDDTEAAKAWFDVWTHPEHSAATNGTAATANPADGVSLELALVDAMLARVETWRCERGHRRARVESGHLRGDLGTEAALAARGFAHVRTFWGMEVTLDPVTHVIPPAPGGVTVRRAADDVAGRELVYRLVSTAFRDHWGHVHRPPDEWWRRVRNRPGLDPTQWWVAELDGEPVGVLMGDTSRAEHGGGFVDTLGVLREGRGRGIARHLLRVAFAEHARRGCMFTQLFVDSQNPTGALQLYRSVGMEPVEVVDVHALQVGSPEPVRVAEPTTRVSS